MHVKTGKPIQNIRRFHQLDPVELDILSGGEMTKATVKITRNTSQTAKLFCIENPIGNRNPEHVGMKLQIQTILQPQRFEFILAQCPCQTAFDLITKLCRTRFDKCAVKLIVVIHRELFS